jgi:hypothetical protein
LKNGLNAPYSEWLLKEALLRGEWMSDRVSWTRAQSDDADIGKSLPELLTIIEDTSTHDIEINEHTIPGRRVTLQQLTSLRDIENRLGAIAH